MKITDFFPGRPYTVVQSPLFPEYMSRVGVGCFVARPGEQWARGVTDVAVLRFDTVPTYPGGPTPSYIGFEFSHLEPAAPR